MDLLEVWEGWVKTLVVLRGLSPMPFCIRCTHNWQQFQIKNPNEETLFEHPKVSWGVAWPSFGTQSCCRHVGGIGTLLWYWEACHVCHYASDVPINWQQFQNQNPNEETPSKHSKVSWGGRMVIHSNSKLLQTFWRYEKGWKALLRYWEACHLCHYASEVSRNCQHFQINPNEEPYYERSKVSWGGSIVIL